MSRSRYLHPRYALREASESLLVAYWDKSDFHAREARRHLIEALIGGGDYDILVECIAEVIRTNPDGPAQAVVDALLDTAIPLSENGGSDEQVS